MFNIENPRIEHLVCKSMPYKIDEESQVKVTMSEEDYLQVYRKQLAVFRHRLYKLMRSPTFG